MSATDIPGDNRNGNKSLLANGVISLFINGKPAAINGLRKIKNPSFCLVIFLVVPFKKITLFYFHDIFNFIIRQGYS